MGLHWASSGPLEDAYWVACGGLPLPILPILELPRQLLFMWGEFYIALDLRGWDLGELRLWEARKHTPLGEAAPCENCVLSDCLRGLVGR